MTWLQKFPQDKGLADKSRASTTLTLRAAFQSASSSASVQNKQKGKEYQNQEMPELKKEKTKHSNNICLCRLWFDYISQNSELHAKKG